MSVSLPPQPPPNRLPAAEPRSERTRRRLLDAGLALFASQGPDAVTSHAIAAEAGYASGTFYLHFKHKQALFEELAERAVAELEARLAAVAALDDAPERLAFAQAESLVGFAEAHRDLFRVVFRAGSEARETGARVLERLARGVRDRRRAELAAGRAWDCLDADVLAQAIVGMWVRVLGWWVEDPKRARRDDVVRTLAHLRLHGSLPFQGRRASHAGACALAPPSPRLPSHPRPRRPKGARRA